MSSYRAIQWKLEDMADKRAYIATAAINSAGRYRAACANNCEVANNLTLLI